MEDHFKKIKEHYEQHKFDSSTPYVIIEPKDIDKWRELIKYIVDKLKDK